MQIQKTVDKTVDKTVVRRNALITAKFDLKVLEYKTMLYIWHKMQLEKSDTVFISVEEFKDIILNNDKCKDPKGKMIKTLDSIGNKKLEIREKVKGGLDWTVHTWISTYCAQFRDIAGRRNVFRGCEVSIDDKIKPYLNRIQGDFTLLQLSDAFSLDSFYAIRIFEMILRFEGRSFRVNLGTLKEHLGLKTTAYPKYKEFKRSVLNPSLESIKKLNRLSDVKFEDGKDKSKITHVIFSSKSKNKNHEDEIDINEIDMEVTDRLEECNPESIDSLSVGVPNESDCDEEGDLHLMSQRSSKSWEIDYDSLNVPEVVKMTEAAKLQFAKEFMHYDFSTEDFSYIILLAWEHITEKDNVKHISMRQYRFFARFIKNKVEEFAYKVGLGM